MDDLTLVERFRSHGDEAAFDEIVRRYQREVFRLAYRVTGSHEDAHDISQEAFLRVYRALGRFRGESSLKTWIYRIVLNLSLDHVNRLKAERTGRVDLDDVSPTVAAEGLTRAIDAERRRRVEGVIECLPEKQKKTLILKVFHDLKYTEIAGVMKCSVGTAKANFFHAVQRLKRELEAGAGTAGPQRPNG